MAAAGGIDESVLLKVIPLSQLAAYEWDIATNVASYNEAFLKLFGVDKDDPNAIEDLNGLKYTVDKEEAIKETARIVKYANSLDLSKEDIVISDEGRFDFVYRLRTADGTIKWANSKGSVIIDTTVDKNTNIKTKRVKVVGIVQDMTKVWDRFKAEVPNGADASSKEVENSMLVTEAIPHLVWANYPSGEPIYFNSRWAEYTGVTLHALAQLGWSWETIIHPEDVKGTLEAWYGALNNGRDSYEARFRLRRRDGVYRWHLGRGVPIKGSDRAKIRQWFSTCTDIHDQKMLEEKAKESELRLKWLIQSFPVNIWTIDNNAIITFMNQQKNADDIGFVSNWVGKSMYDFIKYKGLVGLDQYITRALKGDTFSQELSVDQYWFEVHFWPLRNDKGEMTGVGGVSADITIKKQAEKLIISEQSALKVAQMKSEFLTTMSHEIRTPLNGIIGMSEFLAETKLTDEQTKYLDIIQNSSSHLLNLINDILDYSKIDSGHVDLEPRNFTVSTLLESCLRLFIHKLQSKRLSCGVCVDQTLTKLIMTADEGRISQILINFVSNAIKFTPPNGVINIKAMPMKIENFNRLRNDKEKFLELIPATKCSQVQLEGEEKSIVITETKSTDEDWNISEASSETMHVLFLVRDTGIGVSKETEQKLFKPFVQAMGTHRQFGGTGLGLSICKKLIELMKGEIGVFSVEGKGSLFWFIVPILVKPNTTGELSSPNTERVDVSPIVTETKLVFESSNKKRPTILIVEDHPVNRKLMILTLQKLGCNVTASSNGYEALDILYKENQKFDVIYMDCHMPGLDGYETSREIRKHETAENILKPVPIVALTAAALPGDREKCLDSGMNDYITKPVTRQVIAASIKKWIPWV